MRVGFFALILSTTFLLHGMNLPEYTPHIPPGIYEQPVSWRGKMEAIIESWASDLFYSYDEQGPVRLKKVVLWTNMPGRSSVEVPLLEDDELTAEVDVPQVSPEDQLQDFLQKIPDVALEGRALKEDVESALRSIEPTKRHEHVYTKFSVRSKADMSDKRIDALLMVLNEQLNSSSRDTKMALALTRQQLISAEKSRIAARRATIIAATTTLISLTFNILQAISVLGD